MAVDARSPALYVTGMDQRFSNKAFPARTVLLAFAWLLLAGCEGLEVPTLSGLSREPAQTGVPSDPAGVEEVSAVPGAQAEDFDTTTASEKARASAVTPRGQPLGMTVASLGSPSEPGFWLKTPLVREEMAGVVRSRDTGARVAVTLIPIDGPPTAGSRLSLPAMRLLGVPLTALAKLDVSTAG